MRDRRRVACPVGALDVEVRAEERAETLFGGRHVGIGAGAAEVAHVVLPRGIETCERVIEHGGRDCSGTVLWRCCGATFDGKGEGRCAWERRAHEDEAAEEVWADEGAKPRDGGTEVVPDDAGHGRMA